MFKYHPDPKRNSNFNEEYLIEQSILDAQDLLADLEKESFQRDLLNAPKELQNKIYDLQAEMSEFLALLSKEEPPTHLQERVVNSILNMHEKKKERKPILSMTLWKTAALILFGTVVSLSIINQRTLIINKTLEQAIIGGETLTAITSSLGNEAGILIQDPNAQWRFFKPTKIDGPRGFLINEGDTQKSLIVLLQTPPGAYKVMALDKNYSALSSIDIIMSSSLGGTVVDIEQLKLKNATRITVVNQKGDILAELLL